MGSSGYSRNPSVAHDFAFQKQPEGYSFSQVADVHGHFPVNQQMQYDPRTAGVGAGQSRFVYQRKEEKLCQGLRSQAIIAIVNGVLMVGTSVGLLAYFGTVLETGGLSLAVNTTKCAGIWGGVLAVLGGAMALVTYKKAKQIGPLSRSGTFIGLAVMQLVALAVAAAAAVLAIPAFRIFFLIPTMSFLAETSGSHFELSLPSYWLALFSFLCALGPLNNFLFTLRHTLTIAMDVLSFK